MVAATRVGQIAQKGVRDLAWFVRGLMGEDAYEKYRAHYRSVHEHTPEDSRPPELSEREFWRDRTDRQDKAPEGRCC